MAYDPVKYWIDRGKTYQSEFDHLNWIDQRRYKLQEKALLDHLHTLEFDSVLEIGCGFGRITNIIMNEFGSHICEYAATDLAVDQVVNATHYVNYSARIRFGTFNLFTIDKKIDKKYDLVIAVEVLMHIPPTKISKALNIMYGLANKYVVNVDWYDPNDKKQSDGWCFQHNYKYDKRILIPDIPILGRISKRFKTRQAIFHGDKKLLTKLLIV